MWTSSSVAEVLSSRLEGNVTVVASASELSDMAQEPQTVCFVDSAKLAQLDRAPAAPVIAICDELTTAVDWMARYPWLDNVISTSLLQHPIGAAHLECVKKTLSSSDSPRVLDWLGPDFDARRVRLNSAGRRNERLERMSDFFAAKGVGTRTIERVRDVAEELLTNAFYDAPVAAGLFAQAISRTQDVTLPEEHACELVYGCHGDLAVLRVRDPFGSLRRERLVEVLARCARTDMSVQVDETMGGAGLGLWRVFSAATFACVSVRENLSTEFVIGLGKRSAGDRPFAAHLFFEAGKERRQWRSAEPTQDNSITIVME